jgi:hypothetical protein
LNIDLDQHVKALISDFEALLEVLTDEDGYVLASLVETAAASAKKRLKDNVLHTLKENGEEAEVYGGTLKVVRRVDRKYREKQIKEAMAEADLPLSLVYSWAKSRVLNPSKVDQLVAEGRLTEDIIAPRTTEYIKAKLRGFDG